MNRRGVSAVLGVVLIGIVASVLAGIAAFAAGEQKRANAEIADVQASQLLAAAVTVAKSQLAAGKPVDGDIETPVGHVTLAWQGESCTVDIRHLSAARRATLTFSNGHVAKID